MRRLEVGYDNDDGELESLPNFAEAKGRVGCVGDADECFVISRGGKLKVFFRKHREGWTNRHNCAIEV